MSKEQLFVEEVIKWSEINQRKFPWRKESCPPYQILVAEILLQRTRTDTVVGFYKVFVERYPTVECLFDATIEDLEDELAPLGFHRRRARDLSGMSRMLVNEFKSEIPSDPSDLEKLPGVGQYIAGMVACLAYGVDSVVVDSNIIRVLSRVFDLPPTRDPRKDKDFTELLQDNFPRGRCRDFNLGLVDLGGLVCKPRNPNCCECPLSDICNFYMKRSEISLQ